MKNKIIVLVDFSAHSETLLHMAAHWAGLLHAEVLAVHQLIGFSPAMADLNIRQQILNAQKDEVFQRLTDLTKKHFSGNTKISYRITEDSLPLFLPRVVSSVTNPLVLVGLKGTGLLKQLFVGSTVTKIIDELEMPTVAVPLKVNMLQPKRFIVAVSYKYPLQRNNFQKLLGMFGKLISQIEFISVVTPTDDEAESRAYLMNLQENTAQNLAASYTLFKGDKAFDEIKGYVQQHQDSILVVQKGTRSLLDMLFRKFFINELVHDGSVPLLVIPN